ncbi:Def [Drosophila busckii]|uniref:Def n=1 Tax=Drosophila busckii TaxID=30019 RepID=A0A0M4EAC0_DROBS|nr:defensin [Drosophila busckii]ALC41984.1 Def [Drosophila busckii]
MKLVLFAAALILLTCLAQAQPAYLERPEERNSNSKDTLQDMIQRQTVLYRQKRATCDLLSYLNVNHSACAAHCIAIGFKGGYCNDRAVCNCR